MKTSYSTKTPFHWPFSSGPAPTRNGRLTRRAMLTDVCLVAAWGASIPGLMWLGAAGGF